ncbi:type IV pilus biogenesis/stability protein PilW [Thiorhodococcus drewsii AZ1]|uniref:Type IV pilus biogenesis/stability protein PilW n=1 Tax=Thiorhodococcus drewsii AZ1 TaxID=765913 RepID=G2E3A8_9GAMM|nr:type IV pilus biogenesis/stability protein PilW [Thiorhodococcus drewsii]EGV30297.1 type IV pilus biogenesis/stability protein PilW [Thiorhodococcus drewsii AZ1]
MSVLDARSRLIHRPLAVIGLCWLLGACSSMGTQQHDDELGLDPQDSPAELYVRMAEEYYARGQIEVAFRRAQQAIEADRRYARAQVWIAFLYEEIDKKDLAEDHYEKAVDLAPKSSDILNAYASFQCRQKRYAEADTYFKKALKNPLYTTPWIAMTNAGNCASASGDNTKAEGYYQDAIRANPNFGPALVKMAETAFKRGDAKTAKGYLDRYFDKGTIRTPSTSYTALTVGVQVERRLGNNKRARYYAKALKQNFPVAPKTKEL